MMFLFPATAMVLYILAIGFINFRTRSRSVRERSVKLDYFKTYDEATYKIPEYVVRVGRHYDNQFQLPMLFLITCSLCAQWKVESLVATGFAWFFVFSRGLHSYYHLGANDVLKRAGAFFLGWVAIVALWAVLFYQAIGAEVL